jgi:hypothetical protein
MKVYGVSCGTVIKNKLEVQWAEPVSLEITPFVLIHLQTWLPQAIPVLDWSISKNLLI